MNPDVNFVALLMAGFIGLFVGLSELINRYKSFEKIFSNVFSWLYMIINFVAAITVYTIIKKYNLSLGSIGAHESGVVIFAGLGAMAFLRSSFFSYKDTNDKVIEVGPAAILTVFLRAAERQSDQIISRKNVKEVALLMEGLNFLSASKDLPLIILASMRILNDDEQKVLSEEIIKLVNDSTFTSEAKNIAMGSILVKYTGFELLSEAVITLKKIYNAKTKASLDSISNLQERLKTL